MCPLFLVSQHHIIPVPVQYETRSGFFTWDQSVSLTTDSNDQGILFQSEKLEFYLKESGLPVDSNGKEKAIIIRHIAVYNKEIAKEGYILEINPDVIRIEVNTGAGLFNATQTLRQLIPQRNKANEIIKIPSCKVIDYPRFQWRGLMMDVSRHFFTVEEVKMFIDQMSQYKFNTFHWHLTDDEGWRVEIKSLPRLTEVGAWRVERVGRFGSQRAYPDDGEEATYGGFYTQEEIREVVQYAAERNITIVPEIDVPGHSMAALAAYPELSTKKEPKFVNPGAKFAEWHGNGKFSMLIENTLNPADEAVYEFLDKVFTEVAAVFPGEYIHMGGDECYKGYWEEDPGVKKFMKENDIHDSHELQSYFVKRVERIISSKGKKLIGWDEILEGGLAEGAAVMSWRGMKGGIQAANMGHKVVMSPTTYCYLDYTQGDHSVENRIYADLSLQKSYRFEPIPKDVDPAFILGGQGNLWAEVIPTIDFAFYMAYPRALAIAETVWSPKERKNWDDFIGRVEHHFDVFDNKNRNICQAVYDPVIMVENKNEQVEVTLSCETPDVDIYYTIDNTFPVHFGKKYTGPFIVPKGNLSLKTQTYRNEKALGRLLSIHYDDLLNRTK
ncbi:MAG: family 20 glycosylhydrolase [Saprospiraceae bacterium]|nr:family 20 glycosylhydrolase [Saprospiraceae bacterium]